MCLRDGESEICLASTDGHVNGKKDQARCRSCSAWGEARIVDGKHVLAKTAVFDGQRGRREGAVQEPENL
jgi:hypothetical protein